MFIIKPDAFSLFGQLFVQLFSWPMQHCSSIQPSAASACAPQPWRPQLPAWPWRDGGGPPPTGAAGPWCAAPAAEVGPYTSEPPRWLPEASRPPLGPGRRGARPARGPRPWPSRGAEWCLLESWPRQPGLWKGLPFHLDLGPLEWGREVTPS